MPAFVPAFVHFVAFAFSSTSSSTFLGGRRFKVAPMRDVFSKGDGRRQHEGMTVFVLYEGILLGVCILIWVVSLYQIRREAEVKVP